MNEINPKNREVIGAFLNEAIEADPVNSGLLLKRKIFRIMKTLEALQDKKLSLNLEIQRQQKSLIQKRNELKRTRSSKKTQSNTTVSGTLKLESFSVGDHKFLVSEQDFQTLESYLLTESAKILE